MYHSTCHFHVVPFFVLVVFKIDMTTLIVATLADHILCGSNTDLTTHVWFQNILKN